MPTLFSLALSSTLLLHFPIRTPSRECYSFSLVEGHPIKTSSEVCACASDLNSPRVLTVNYCLIALTEISKQGRIQYWTVFQN